MRTPELIIPFKGPLREYESQGATYMEFESHRKTNARTICTGLLSLIGLAMTADAVGNDERIRAGAFQPDSAGPSRGDFPWRLFSGSYDFSDCKNLGKPIWNDSPEPGTFIVIEVSHGFERIPTTYSLSVTRGHARQVLALGWTFENVGEKSQKRVDSRSGRVITAWESYATANGVYGARAWNNPYNGGWSTFQLTMVSDGEVRYRMRQKTDSDRLVRDETCTLRPRSP